MTSFKKVLSVGGGLTILALGVALLPVAASGGRAAGGAQPSGSPVKFGLLAGVTGDYAPWTGPALKANTIAIADINRAGGVLGRPARMIVADNKSTVEGAVSGFNKLVDVDGIHAVGGLESDAAVALLPTLGEQGIPAMCPQCGTAELDKKGGKWIWRLTASDTDIGLVSAQFARSKGYRKMALMALKSEGSASSAKTFKDAYVGKVRGEICQDVRFDPGRATYAAELQKAFSCDPQALYLTAGFEQGVTIIREWERRGYGGRFIFAPDLIAPEIAEVSDKLENGVAVGPTAAFDTTSPAYKPFERKYKAATGKLPSAALWEAGQYDQYILLSLAMTAANTADDGAKIARAVSRVANPPGTRCYFYNRCLALLKAGREIDYHGASGSLNFNAFGNLRSPLFAELHVKDDDWVQVKTIALDPRLRK
jgi:branched-chain amino acid transport system substrate-binding protein